MNRELFVIIVGCGRVGSILASSLSREGHAVVVIDRYISTFKDLSPEFSGFQIEGDATELSILRQAKLDKAQALIATTHKDNVNLMVAQIAKRIFAVPTVMARVFDPKREDLYRSLGIETICPTCLAAEKFLKVLGEMGSGDRGETP
ncbi:MAG TPA: TrkA family potassium uptake protein [Desulfobacterales bacterium]|jgi:trk system potassium uptake protein TrkA|nr:TrkA family potassium uptake protein [Desulfobacterales bacterium]